MTNIDRQKILDNISKQRELRLKQAEYAARQKAIQPKKEPAKKLWNKQKPSILKYFFSNKKNYQTGAVYRTLSKKKDTAQSIVILFLLFGFWLVTIMSVVPAEASNTVVADLQNKISILQQKWRDNEREYIAKQEFLHEQANKLRAEIAKNGKIITVTSYNPLPEQTDASPCHGAGGDVCHAYAQNQKPIALSRDLLTRWGGQYRYGDRVRLEGGNCSGEYLVLDTMNARFKNRADIFFPSRKMNTGCKNVILSPL